MNKVAVLLFGLAVLVPSAIEGKVVKARDEYHKHNYTIYEKEMTWFDAMSACGDHEKLLSVDNVEEMEFVRGFVKRSNVPESCIWTSGVEVGHYRKFLWANNGLWIAPAMWTNDEPSSITEHCVSVMQKSGNVYLNDVVCEDKCPLFVCKSDHHVDEDHSQHGHEHGHTHEHHHHPHDHNHNHGCKAE